MDFSYYKNQVAEWAAEGRDYEQINQLLLQKGLPDEDRKTLLKVADQAILQYEFAQQARMNAILKMILGAALLCIGGVVAIISGSILKNQYYLMLGIILAGGWFLKEGYKSYKSPPSEVKASNLIRKRNKFERF